MAYEMVMPYHLHMPSYFLETFTEYPHKFKVPFPVSFINMGKTAIHGFSARTHES